MASRSIAAVVLLFFSTTLLIISTSLFFVRPGSSLRLTWSIPFTDWSAITDVYRNGMVNVSSNATAHERVHHAAWCDKYSPRPWSAPANRSDMCACLTNNTAAFLAEANTNLTRDLYSEKAKACYRRRPVWDVWDCGDYCGFHPMAIAYYVNAVLFLFMLDYVLRYFVYAREEPIEEGQSRVYNRRQAVFFFSTLCVMGVLAGMLRQSSIIYILTMMAVPLFTTFSIDAQEEDPFMTHVWFYYTFALPSLVCFMGAASTVRDVTGLFVYAGLGYLLGILGQRLYWSKTYEGDAGLGWYIRLFLLIPIVSLLGGLAIMTYINWFGSSPMLGTLWTMICVLIYVAPVFVEYFLSSHGGLTNAIHMGLILAGNGVFLVVSAIDTFK